MRKLWFFEHMHFSIRSYSSDAVRTELDLNTIEMYTNVAHFNLKCLWCELVPRHEAWRENENTVNYKKHDFREMVYCSYDFYWF